MRIELQNNLKEKHPFLNRIEDAESQSDLVQHLYRYRVNGIELDDSWYDLLNQMFSDIEKLYAEANQPVDLLVLKATSRNGCLQFYYRTDTAYFVGHYRIIQDVPLREVDEKVCDLILKYREKGIENNGKVKEKNERLHY